MGKAAIGFRSSPSPADGSATEPARPAHLDRRRFLALTGGAALTAGLVACGVRPPPERSFTFSVATRGAISADVEAFAASALATLNDNLGWSLGGAIAFARVPSGGDLTLWLCQDVLVPSFSSGCSSQWSCRVGRDVIINQTRWLTGTPTWPYGLPAYQQYVVNHEVGHWFGMDHWPSPGPGQRCPVMFQQSMGITDGSTYNTWPIEAERQWVASRWGVTAR